MSLLELTDLGVTLRQREVLRGVSLRIGAGEVVGLIGANGAGKSTLMRAALGLVPATGRSSLAVLSPAERARAAGWMPQTREVAWPVSVETLVLLGRIPHLSGGQQIRAADREAVTEALAQMGLESFRDRKATRLSGGELARALIARVLAQETPLLIADEPIAGLDPAHQIATMQLFETLARDGKSALVSIHDLGLAARHCTRLILLADGGIVADGHPEEVLTPDLLARHFGIRAHFAQTADGLIFQPLETVQ